MGTRADFYVGRGKAAEWIGSIAFDGYPHGDPKPILEITDEGKFRVEVEAVLRANPNSATYPKDGWPWPWKNSNTTDYAYAFDEGRVWGTCFGHGWWPADKEPEGGDAPKITDWPEMDTTTMTLGPRSGLIVLGGPQ